MKTSSALNFTFTRNVFIGKIALIPPTEKEKAYWQYIVKETNSRGITHTTAYHSRNYLTIKAHRERVVKHYKQLQEDIDRGSFWQGVELKPSLIDRILAKANQHIK